MSNTSIHEFDVALSPGVASPAFQTRQMAREIHLNVWVTGAKGSPIASNIGGSQVTASTGIMVLQPKTAVALSNGPVELVIGDSAAAPGLINMQDVYGVTSLANLTFSGFGIP